MNNPQTVYIIQVQVSETEGYIHQLNEVTQFYTTVLKAQEESKRLAAASLGFQYTVVKFQYEVN